MLTDTDIIKLTTQSLSLVLEGSAPAMLAAAGAGILVAILQALTQVQDQGLPTAVKFFAVVAVLYGTYLGLASSLMTFGDTIFGMIENL